VTAAPSKLFKDKEICFDGPDISAYGYDENLLNIFNKIKHWVTVRAFLLFSFIAHEKTIKIYPLLP
jgi:hypothetical protein